MRIVLSKKAEKQLESLAADVAMRIIGKIKQYAADPASLANQVTRLKGVEHMRLRVGDYRVIFTEDGLVLNILRIGHRREVYH